jgi:alpha-amylase/alpha-mannosidase (GH57 family)
MMKSGFLVIHGHFYQPPRENPYIDFVEKERSASPFHDWNQRITHECYAPNFWARLYGSGGLLRAVVNNYSFLSFDIGPTLFRWLRKNAPSVYQAIIQGDMEARKRFSGHGSAISHPYSHLILPLASEEDKDLNVKWGIEEFKFHFKREPEGMWLPECAVDTETLEVLARHGISFVILSPFQAKRTKRFGEYWQEVEGGRIDPFRPYKVKLPSGREINVFFFHHALSMGVSFGDLLKNGEWLLNEIKSAMPQGGSPLLSIVTDGETFGHHKAFGEMALAYLFSKLKEQKDIKLTVFGEFLEKHPPTDQVQIQEKSSWSCSHGLERWKEDCGCSCNLNPQWNQKWRRPLREALDWLREALKGSLKSEAAQVFFDFQKAKEDYIQVILDPDKKDRFLKEHLRSGSPQKALALLEIERESLLMFTSCAWFFDDPSGIETLLVLKHASRAIDLGRRFLGIELEREFLERLREVKSNIPEKGDGEKLYLREVLPHKVDLKRGAFHLIFQSFLGRDEERFGALRVKNKEEEEFKWGKATLKLGKIEVEEERTSEEGVFSFSLLSFGDHNLVCGIGKIEEKERIKEAFRQGDLSGSALLIKESSEEVFTLSSLLSEFQEEAVELFCEETFHEIGDLLEGYYERLLPLMSFMKKTDFDPPYALRKLAECIFWIRAKRALEKLSPFLLREALREAEELGLKLDLSHFRAKALRILEDCLEGLLREEFTDFERLEKLIELSDLLRLPLGKAQAYLFMFLKKQKEITSEALLRLAKRLSIEV